MTQTIIAYIPVIHQGYLTWLRQYPEAEVLVLGETITQQFRPLQKDIRALDPSDIVTSLLALKVIKTARVVEAEDMTQVSETSTGQIIMPKEVVSQAVAQQYLSGHQIHFESIFLRWDGEKAVAPQPVTANKHLDEANTQQFFLQLARTEAQKSADWWRQVGVAVIKDGKVILTAYNQHLPSEQQPYIDGDPRADFHKGDHIELSTAIHAEAAAIADAARQGLSLAGATIYVTTFPCPNCAKLIAQSGLKELIFADGYSMLDGEQVLKTAGVTITQLTTNT